MNANSYLVKTASEFVICHNCQRATRRDDITRVDVVGGEPLCSECEQEVMG